jgi:hypothetical protein
LIVAFRILLLFLAASAAVVAARISLREQGSVAATARYACPMHPEVQSDTRGECPICRMALEPVATKSHVDMPGMSDMAAVDNIRKHNVVDFVRKRSLLPVLQELRGPAQVEADGTISALFYKDQIEAMAADEWGSFSLGAAPASKMTVHRTTDAPVPWDGATSRIRFRLDAGGKGGSPAGHALRAGQAGWIEVAPRPRQVLTVAASAVLQSDEGPYVLAWTGHGFTFEKRRIEIGETFARQGFAVVLSGLQVYDRVIARATFFVEADRRQGGHTVTIDPEDR